MKKISIFAILLSLFLTLTVSSQTKLPGDGKTLTNEQKMLPFAMSMALTVVGEMHDEQYLSVLTIFQKQMPYWSEALKPVVEMDKDIEDYKRLGITIKASEVITAKSDKSDKWQIMVGDKFGSIYAMIKKNKSEGREIDASDLKFNIDLISILANKPPEDIPAEVNAKFKEFGSLKDEPNLTSDKNVKKITETVVGILNTISK